MTNTIINPIEPIYDKNSKVLILGTMPSPKSREVGFYYGHPQNRFWNVMSEVFSVGSFVNNADKINFLLHYGIAMWDTLAECEINGADDGSIRNPVANDLSPILATADIRKIYTTGTKATSIYKKFIYPKTGIESVYLPSSSPANRKHYSFDDLVLAYRQIREILRHD